MGPVGVTSGRSVSPSAPMRSGGRGTLTPSPGLRQHLPDTRTIRAGRGLRRRVTLSVQWPTHETTQASGTDDLVDLVAELGGASGTTAGTATRIGRDEPVGYSQGRPHAGVGAARHRSRSRSGHALEVAAGARCRRRWSCSLGGRDRSDDVRVPRRAPPPHWEPEAAGLGTEATSSRPGTPSLRTKKTSRGASRARATS